MREFIKELAFVLSLMAVVAFTVEAEARAVARPSVSRPSIARAVARTAPKISTPRSTSPSKSPIIYPWIRSGKDEKDRKK